MKKDQKKFSSFTSTESKILLELATRIEMTAQEIATFLTIPRTSAYNIIKQLERRGVLKTILNKRKRTIALVSPSELELLGKKQSQELTESFSSLAEILQSNMVTSQNFFDSRLELFSDKTGIEKVLFGLLQSKSKKVRFIIKDHANLNLLDKKLSSELVNLRVARGISSQALVPRSLSIPKESIFALHKKYNREVKELPENFSLGTNIVMYDETVGFITLGNQTMCFRVVDKAFSETMNSFFDNLWK